MPEPSPPSFVKWQYAAIVMFNKLKQVLSGMLPRKSMTVVIKQGTLKGLYYQTRISKKPYVSFLGIPYAKPPVKELRFKPPDEHPGWSGVFKAYSDGKICTQYEQLVTKKVIGSEDCLYLNVFVPQIESNEKKAVMVFIHGGAFNFGSGSTDIYTPDYLLDENVIVVTINYRLNVLGFLNLDIDDCPGNMGLKDQRLAFQWVKDNISEFGGNSDNITIFGQSAGSASVHFHTLSSKSSGLFQKAIMQSGFALNPWAFHKNHKETALNFAKRLGCQVEDPKEILKYLRNIPAKELVEHSKKKDIREDGELDILHYEFAPSLESDTITDRFISAYPEVLIKTATPIPTMSGINSTEGLIAFGERILGNVHDYHKVDQIKLLLDSHYDENVMNKIQHFYFNELSPECESTQLVNICNLFTDVLFTKGFQRAFKYQIQQNDVPVYNYEFKFDGEISIFKKLILALNPQYFLLKGACHGDELSYMFYSILFGFTPKANSPEFKMCKVVSKLWTNFAKTGNPNSSDLSFKWNPTSSNEPKYLSIDKDNISMIDGFVQHSRAKFWENLLDNVELDQNL